MRIKIRRLILVLLVVPTFALLVDASPVFASCGSASTSAYIDCTDSGTITPMGVINTHNWDFGPRDYALLYNGQLIGTTSNYIHGYTAGRDR